MQKCYSLALCPFLQLYSNFPCSLCCHSPPVHQTPSDFSTCFPDPATPICPEITANPSSFPSPWLPRPSPHLYLIFSSPFFFCQNIVIVMFFVSAFELLFSVSCYLDHICICLPAFLDFSLSHPCNSVDLMQLLFGHSCL